MIIAPKALQRKVLIVNDWKRGQALFLTLEMECIQWSLRFKGHRKPSIEAIDKFTKGVTLYG